ncbi:MAG: MFS transporter, partial [Nitrospinota bacterium]
MAEERAKPPPRHLTIRIHPMPSSTPPPRPYLWLAGICAARVLFNTVNFNYPAAIPILQPEWGMTATQAGLILSAFEVGYLLSLVGVSYLSDWMSARRVFLGSCLGGAFTAMLFAAFARSFESALLLRFLNALFLGGAYTPVLKLIAEAFESRARGRAMGFFIASAAVGNALSLSAAGVLIAGWGYRAAFWATSLGPLLGWAISWWALRGSTLGAPSPSPRGRTLLALTNKPAMLLLAGYTVHAWELMGMRYWTPAFITAAVALGGVELAGATGVGANLSALFLLAGVAGTAVAGFASDLLGRTVVIAAMMVISALCSFVFGWAVTLPFWVLVGLGCVYGFAVIADSPVYSTGFTEVVPPHYLGAALGLRSLAGFGAGAIS